MTDKPIVGLLPSKNFWNHRFGSEESNLKNYFCADTIFGELTCSTCAYQVFGKKKMEDHIQQKHMKFLNHPAIAEITRGQGNLSGEKMETDSVDTEAETESELSYHSSSEQPVEETLAEITLGSNEPQQPEVANEQKIDEEALAKEVGEIIEKVLIETAKIDNSNAQENPIIPKAKNQFESGYSVANPILGEHKCNTCGYTTFQKSVMIKHIQRKHRTVPEKTHEQSEPALPSSSNPLLPPEPTVLRVDISRSTLLESHLDSLLDMPPYELPPPISPIPISKDEDLYKVVFYYHHLQ